MFCMGRGGKFLSGRWKLVSMQARRQGGGRGAIPPPPPLWFLGGLLFVVFVGFFACQLSKYTVMMIIPLPHYGNSFATKV